MRNWTQEESQPLPPWLLEAVDALMADFQQPSPIDVRLGFDAAQQTLWIGEAGGRDASFAFGLWGEERGAALLITLAHWLQEQFFPETLGAWGQARPECPGHTHPAYAGPVGEQAWWLCALDHHQIAQVGHLGDHELVYLAHEVVRFNDESYRWVDLQRFRLPVHASIDDALDLLLRHVRYRDHYASSDSHERPTDNLHGPYWLDHITGLVRARE